MNKYFVLYKASPEMFKKWMSMPKEEQQKGMDAWKKWMEKHAGDFADDGGPLSKVKIVTPQGVTDGHNDIGAYSIVNAESLEAAAEMFKDSPHFSDIMPNSGTIEVMEMPAMPM